MCLDSNLIYFCTNTFNMKYYAIIALAFVTACGGADTQAKEDAKPADQPMAESKNSPSFNQKFTNFLNNYYKLKDALVSSDDALATQSAQLLAVSADSLDLKEIKADSSIVTMAKGYVESVAAEAKALPQEKDLEAKRKSFQMISDNMYDLVRTVHFDKEVVYHQFCPMAFNDAGAYWLSQSADIKNPYYGKKMLTCGEVKDSLDFRGK